MREEVKMGSYEDYKDAKFAADPDLKAEYDALGPEYERIQEGLEKEGAVFTTAYDVARYEESLARTGEPIPLEYDERL